MSEIDDARDRLASLLKDRDLKVVFAESCTGGLVSATLAQVSGISNYLCGSAVTYRPAAKQRWLGVPSDTIDEHSCESQQVADEMVLGALKTTPEADWAASVVGHCEGEGFVWISVARRDASGRINLQDTHAQPLEQLARIDRQREAAAIVLINLADCITRLAE